jgi:NADH pyrophosphatase NudC (nudix superfamily)
MAKLRNRIAEVGSKSNMRKTTIELTEAQYFFLKEKALELQKQNQNASIVSIIRDLIEKDRQECARGKKEKRG